MRGKVGVEWRRSGDGLELKLEAPTGSQLRAAIPAEGWSSILEGEQVVWENEQPGLLPEGVTSAAREGDRVVFTLGGGSYIFHSKI